MNMNILEKRFYPTKELAQYFSINPKSKNKPRDIQCQLDNLRYCYSYQKDEHGFYILETPSTNGDSCEERLKGILYRYLGLSKQIDAVSYALFLKAFSEISGFDCMPWAVREEVLRKEYGLNYAKATYRNWFSKLINKGYAGKGAIGAMWKTAILKDGSLVRCKVLDGDRQMTEYYAERNRMLSVFESDNKEMGFPPKIAKNNAWKSTIAELWNHYHCCYYSCKTLTLFAFSNDGENLIQEVYRLVDEVLQNYVPPRPAVGKAADTTQSQQE